MLHSLVVVVFTFAVISVLISAQRTINCDTAYESSDNTLHCDSFGDLKELLPTVAYENFTILSLGDEEIKIQHEAAVSLKEDSFPASNKNLKTLEIYSVLNGINANSFQGKNFQLRFAILKGNDLIILRKRSFSGIKAISLHLINNKIEIIEGGAFEDASIENLDLSDNKIVNIVGNSLPTDLQELMLDRNNIFRIVENTLPKHLYVLHLNFNNIKNCNDLEGLKTSNSLETLSISRNKIEECIQFPSLMELQSLNMSENKIKVAALNAIPNIQYLYLGHNKLESVNLSKWRDLKELDVQFNFLHYLNFNESLSKNLVKLSVAGNPFTCKCFDAILNYARLAKFKVETCDSDSKKGIPDCIAYGQSCEFLQGEEYQKFVSANYYEEFLNNYKRSSCYKHK